MEENIVQQQAPAMPPEGKDTPFLQAAQVVLNFVFSPSIEDVYEVRQKNYVYFPYVVFLLAIFTYCLSFGIFLVVKMKTHSMLLSNVFFISLFIAVKLIVFTAWVNLVSSYTSKYGNVKDLIKLLLVSYSPLFLALPAALIINASSAGHPVLLFLAVSLALFILVIVNMFQSVRFNYSFTKGQTLLIFIMPAVIIQLLAGLFVFMVFYYLVSLI